VSLREIRLAAGERNNSALQFHFGDRDGLLLALTQRHLPRITRVQEQLYGRLVAEGRHTDFGALVEVMVRPHAEYLRRGPSERAWTRIVAGQASRPDVTFDDLLQHAPAVSLHAGATLHDQLTATMDPAIATERLMSVLEACTHLCADRARIEDALAPARDAPGDPAGAGAEAGAGAHPSRPARPVLPFDTWLANLLDMAVGALQAPVHRAGPRPAGVGDADAGRAGDRGDQT
jgi:AcrR family transcriptional regulator